MEPFFHVSSAELKSSLDLFQQLDPAETDIRAEPIRIGRRGTAWCGGRVTREPHEGVTRLRSNDNTGIRH